MIPYSLIDKTEYFYLSLSGISKVEYYGYIMEKNISGIINLCQDRFYEFPFSKINNIKQMFVRDFQKSKTIVTVSRKDGYIYF